MSKKLTIEKINKIKSDASKYWTLEEHIKQLQEECVELTLALFHFNRGKASKDDVLTEIADVLLMIEYFVDTEKFGSDKDLIDEWDRKYLKMQKLMDAGKR